MFPKLYINMALYFLAVILTTLVAAGLLFFFTVGRPLARDVHTMLRSHTKYLAALVKEADAQGKDKADLVRSFDLFTENYGFDIALLDSRRQRIVTSSALKGRKIALTETMFDHIAKQGIFVQSSHFGRPVIYMLPVTSATGAAHYLYMTKQFPKDRKRVTFLIGLAVVGVLLILAVYPLSKNITRPLTRLTEDFEKIAAGRFDDIPESRRKDEIGTLIRGYRAMSHSLDRLIESKKQLLADISHELCSPLGRIRVGTELIKEASTDPKTLRRLENIETDIASMDHLVANLSAYSRMNLPGFSLALSAISPKDLVREIRALYLPIAERRRIRIDNLAVAEINDITGDHERLKQVFSNLMDNALHYTDDGGTIRLGAEEAAERVCFFVEDGGPGVPEPEAEKIFAPLYRVDFSRNRELGGAGLGLTISRKIVELHGGELHYTRTNDRTRFTFCLKKTATA